MTPIKTATSFLALSLVCSSLYAAGEEELNNNNNNNTSTSVTSSAPSPVVEANTPAASKPPRGFFRTLLFGPRAPEVQAPITPAGLASASPTPTVAGSTAPLESEKARAKELAEEVQAAVLHTQIAHNSGEPLTADQQKMVDLTRSMTDLDMLALSKVKTPEEARVLFTRIESQMSPASSSSPASGSSTPTEDAEKAAQKAAEASKPTEAQWTALGKLTWWLTAGGGFGLYGYVTAPAAPPVITPATVDHPVSGATPAPATSGTTSTDAVPSVATTTTADSAVTETAQAPVNTGKLEEGEIEEIVSPDVTVFDYKADPEMNTAIADLVKNWKDLGGKIELSNARAKINGPRNYDENKKDFTKLSVNGLRYWLTKIADQDQQNAFTLLMTGLEAQSSFSALNDEAYGLLRTIVLPQNLANKLPLRNSDANLKGLVEEV